MNLVFLGLLDIMEANENGMRRDLDSEFLHDFRTALRRSRSAMSQVPGVYSTAAAEEFSREMRWVFGETNGARDLDVYRLKMPSYRQRLPLASRSALEPLEEFLRISQGKEQRRVASMLSSRRYRSFVGQWREFLESGPIDEGKGPRAGLPIGKLASRRIVRAFRRVLERGGAIGDETPAEALHNLRKDCKKLRYLLELFRSLFPKSLNRFIRALKQLQDTLGDFQDFEVQQEHLGDYAAQMASKGEVPPETLLSMGRLLAHQEQAQGEARLDFASRFAVFSSAKNQYLLNQLMADLKG